MMSRIVRKNNETYYKPSVIYIYIEHAYEGAIK